MHDWGLGLSKSHSVVGKLELDSSAGFWGKKSPKNQRKIETARKTCWKTSQNKINRRPSFWFRGRPLATGMVRVQINSRARAFERNGTPIAVTISNSWPEATERQNLWRQGRQMLWLLHLEPFPVLFHLWATDTVTQPLIVGTNWFRSW